jgi:kinesin family protein 4/21/27
MNQRSSRSHAIFTITLEQRKTTALPIRRAGGGEEEDDDDEPVEDYLCAKMHLVDLAGKR